jgi:hypothetical protein
VQGKGETEKTNCAHSTLDLAHLPTSVYVMAMIMAVLPRESTYNSYNDLQQLVVCRSVL